MSVSGLNTPAPVKSGDVAVQRDAQPLSRVEVSRALITSPFSSNDGGHWFSSTAFSQIEAMWKSVAKSLRAGDADSDDGLDGEIRISRPLAQYNQSEPFQNVPAAMMNPSIGYSYPVSKSGDLFTTKPPRVGVTSAD